MLLEGFEKDFNEWELSALKECNILRDLLDDSFLVDVDKIQKFYKTDAAEFVKALKNLKEKLFCDIIARQEEIDAYNAEEVIAILHERNRIGQEQISLIEAISNLRAGAFEGFVFPDKEKIARYRFAKKESIKARKQLTKVDDEEIIEEPEDSEESQKSQMQRQLQDDLEQLYLNYRDLTDSLKAFTKIATWYYRTYKEPPDVGFQWRDEEDEEKETPAIGVYAANLADKYNIYYSPVRTYEQPVIVEKNVQVDKVIPIHVPVQTVKELSVDKVVEKKVAVIQPQVMESETLIEKPVEVIKEVEVVKKVEVPVVFNSEIQSEKLVEKPVPFEVIKEVEVIQEVEKPVTELKWKKPPKWFVAAGITILFCIIGAGIGLALRTVLLPPGDEELQKIAQDAKDSETKAINDAALRIKNAIDDANAKVKSAEEARDKALSEVAHVQDLIKSQEETIKDNGDSISKLNQEISDLNIQINDLTLDKKKLENQRDQLLTSEANLKKILEERGSISKNELEKLNQLIRDKDDEIAQLKLDNEDSLEKLREYSRNKIQELIAKYKDELAVKDDEILKLTNERDDLDTRLKEALSTGGDAVNRINELNSQLQEKTRALETSENNLVQSQAEVAKLIKERDGLSANLKQTQDNLEMTSANLKNTQTELDSTKTTLSETEATLSTTQNDLKNANDNVSLLTEDKSRLENENAFLKEKLLGIDEDKKIMQIEKTLLASAKSARSAERAREIKTRIEEFIDKYPSRKPNFVKALNRLKKVIIYGTGGSFNKDTEKEFIELAKISNGTAYKSSDPNELPGILEEILNSQIGLSESADVVFLFDTSSSMVEEIDAVKREVTNVVGNLKTKCPDVRVAVVLYRDLRSPEYCVKLNDFTLDLEKASQAVKDITLENGPGNYDIPEAVYEGIMESFKKLHWCHRAEKRLIILVGDAPPAVGPAKVRPSEEPISHEWVLKDIEKQLNSMKTELDTKDSPVQIFPVIIAK